MRKTDEKKRVVVFGVFDGIHDGHRDFFRQAREYGDELVAIVGRDEVALQLKNKKPRYSQEERLRFVKREQGIDDGVLGDEEPSSYQVMETLTPDVVCMGYDQQVLAEDLKKWMKAKRKEIPIYFLKPYKPEIFHNSFLRD